MTYESEPVQILLLKKRVAELLVELADAKHMNGHALVEIVEAREGLAKLKERARATGCDSAFALIDAQLRNAGRFIREQKCPCAGVTRVTVSEGESATAPSHVCRVLPMRKMAMVRKPPSGMIRDLLVEAAKASEPDPKPGGAA